MKELIDSVLPFEALSFKSLRTIPASARQGLDVLEASAKTLLRELSLDGYATGMDVQVQVVFSLYNLS